jgi:hypothetical protein
MLSEPLIMLALSFLKFIYFINCGSVLVDEILKPNKAGKGEKFTVWSRGLQMISP